MSRTYLGVSAIYDAMIFLIIMMIAMGVLIGTYGTSDSEVGDYINDLDEALYTLDILLETTVSEVVLETEDPLILKNRTVKELFSFAVYSLKDGETGESLNPLLSNLTSATNKTMYKWNGWGLDVALNSKGGLISQINISGGHITRNRLVTSRLAAGRDNDQIEFKLTLSR